METGCSTFALQPRVGCICWGTAWWQVRALHNTEESIFGARQDLWPGTAKVRNRRQISGGPNLPPPRQAWLAWPPTPFAGENRRLAEATEGCRRWPSVKSDVSGD